MIRNGAISKFMGRQSSTFKLNANSVWFLKKSLNYMNKLYATTNAVRVYVLQKLLVWFKLRYEKNFSNMTSITMEKCDSYFSKRSFRAYFMYRK